MIFLAMILGSLQLDNKVKEKEFLPHATTADIERQPPNCQNVNPVDSPMYESIQPIPSDTAKSSAFIEMHLQVQPKEAISAHLGVEGTIVRNEAYGALGI